ncbi:hypothetical protein D1007_03411 [Hordeum vulgare]|nr:hypothetical protein D1007_03411 [Hordeum vulgare]
MPASPAGKWGLRSLVAYWAPGCMVPSHVGPVGWPLGLVSVQCCAYTGFSIHSMACSVALDDGVLHKVEAAAYWTAVVPNVEEYGNVMARAITSGDENVAKRILWRGVMTVDMLPWGTRCSRRGSKLVILRLSHANIFSGICDA